MPQGLVDLHNHLLPGVDDGSSCQDETLRHLRLLAEDGVTEVVFTPHLLAARLEPRGIDAVLRRQQESFAQLRERIGQLGEEGLPALHLGCEILATGPDDISRVADRLDVTLGASAWLLVEFGFDAHFDAHGVLDAAETCGRRVLLAHPERCAVDGSLLEAARSWRARGAALQVNIGSLAGSNGERAHGRAWDLVMAGLADVIASDHHGDTRPDRPARVVAQLREAVGPDEARRLMADNPARLLAGAPLRQPGGVTVRRQDQTTIVR